MFCIKCGVELSKGQTVCPLCKTKVYHPEFEAEDIPTYPKKEFESEEFNRTGLMFILTGLCLLALLLPIVVELSLKRGIDWSGYASGGVLLGYLIFLLPLWFKAPNPVIFVPCDFAGITLFLLYVNLQTNGDWFLSFAFPVTVSLGMIFTALTALLHYVRHGKLYIIGGWFMALGAWTVLLEFFMRLTFDITAPFWSLFCLVPLFMIGMMLTVTAIVKPLKESLRRKFFIR